MEDDVLPCSIEERDNRIEQLEKLLAVNMKRLMAIDVFAHERIERILREKKREEAYERFCGQVCRM